MDSGDLPRKSENYVAKQFSRSIWKQVILALLTNFSSIAPSMSLGFSAVAIPVLTNTSNEYFLNDNAASWFASIASLATPFGCLLSGPIADKYGRRVALLAINIICFIGWIIIGAAYFSSENQYIILLFGRLFTGLSTGLASIPATIYMAENSSNQLRAVFCTWNTISFAIGVLTIYFLGFIFQENLGIISLITAVFPCMGLFFVVFFVPESPSWLIRKHRDAEAIANMCAIFGTKEQNLEVQQEISNLMKARGNKEVAKKTKIANQILKKIRYLTERRAMIPLLLIIGFFFFQQASGTFVTVFYAIDIVKEAGIQLDPNLTIVLIGIVRLFSAILASYISKRFGRRPLSIISGSGMTVCMMVIAVYILYIKPGRSDNSLSFLPVLLLHIYFFISSIGFLPIPFAISAEVFPLKIRGCASGLASAVGYFFNFIAVKLYPSMNETLGAGGIFFFYGGMSLAGTIFVLKLLPETKGKSLEEIEEYFHKKTLKEPVLRPFSDEAI